MPRYSFADDVLALYDNGVPVRAIAKRYTHVTKSGFRKTLVMVQEIIYRDTVWTAAPAVDCPDLASSRSRPPATIATTSWAVGDLCTHRD